MKLLLGLLFIVSLSFAATTYRIEGSANIFNFLYSPHAEFKNPYCLSKYIRADSEKHDIYIATGYHIAALTITTTEVGVVAIDIGYLSADDFKDDIVMCGFKELK